MGYPPESAYLGTDAQGGVGGRPRSSVPALLVGDPSSAKNAVVAQTRQQVAGISGGHGFTNTYIPELPRDVLAKRKEIVVELQKRFEIPESLCDVFERLMFALFESNDVFDEQLFYLPVPERFELFQWLFRRYSTPTGYFQVQDPEATLKSLQFTPKDKIKIEIINAGVGDLGIKDPVRLKEASICQFFYHLYSTYHISQYPQED